MSIDLTPHKAAKGSFARLLTCMFRQRSKTRSCPDTPRLDGKTVLVTGGSAGVGEFISRGLLKRGANVVSLLRGVSQGTGDLEEVVTITCDLANPASVVSAVAQLSTYSFDILICNSGILMRNYQVTPEGLEKTFAVNVFGHHLLYRLMIERGLFVGNARIVMTSGDAYIVTDKCEANPETSQYNQAYGGSKLGNLWQVRELKERYPKLRAYAVHPGVVLSGFTSDPKEGFGHWCRSKLMLSEEQGAQSALIAATQQLPNGAYWHNVSGIMDLAKNDVAMDAEKSAELWATLETYTQPWLSRP